VAGEILERVISDARTLSDVQGSQATTTYNFMGSRQIAIGARLFSVYLQDDDGSGFMQVWLAERLGPDNYDRTQVTNVGFDQTGPQIYAGADGVIHLAWIGRGFGVANPAVVHVNYVRVVAGVVGTIEPVEDGASPAYICSLAVTEDNRPFVAVCVATPSLDIFERTGVATWVSRMAAVNTNTPESPSMLIDNVDVLQIAWADLTYAGGIATGSILWESFNTTTFLSLGQLTVDAQGGRTVGNNTVTPPCVQLAIDAADDAHVVYGGLGPVNGTLAISYQRQVAGVFQGQQILAGDLVAGGAMIEPQVTVDNADNIYVFWHERKVSSGEFARLKYRKSTTNGVSFAAEITVTQVKGYHSVMFQPHPGRSRFAEDEWLMVAESSICGISPTTTVEASSYFTQWFFEASQGTMPKFTADRVFSISVDPLFGSRAYQLSIVGAAPINRFASIGQQVSAAAAEVWSFAVRAARFNSNTLAGRLIVTFRDNLGAIVGTFQTAEFTPGGWTLQSLLNITAPATTASVRVVLQVRTTSTISGGEFLYTGAQAVLGATVPAWPDFASNRLLSGSFQDFQVVGGVLGSFPTQVPASITAQQQKLLLL
jgi:hypothetical protein